MKIRTGFGYDVHRLAAGESLFLGGIKIDHPVGTIAHSDGDVLIHAICDALLGAAGISDIGHQFPDHDMGLKNIRSTELLKRTAKLIRSEGYSIGNIDTTLCLEAPKIAGWIPSMKQTLADFLEIDPSDISIKATTNEKLGFIGREEGLTAFATVLIYKT